MRRRLHDKRQPPQPAPAPGALISRLTAVTQDLSVAVPEHEDGETLGYRVRDALGADTNCLEPVTVLSATAYQWLPASA